MVNLLLNFEAINYKITRAWVKSNVMDPKLSYVFHGIRLILTKSVFLYFAFQLIHFILKAIVLRKKERSNPPFTSPLIVYTLFSLS